MASSRRSKFEIWSEVLQSCLRKKRTQTWLLRETRLKTSVIKEVLEFLTSRNLIEHIDESDNIRYQTTDRGKEALKKFYTLINDYFDLKLDKHYHRSTTN